MFQENVLLKNHSHYKIGGLARYFFESDNVEGLTGVIDRARKEKIPIFILGGGTNVLFSDKGFPGLILKSNNRRIESGGDRLLRVGAATPIEDLIDYSMAKNLSGLEWAGGLPGTLGGALYGNAGCFGGEIKDNVQEVISLNISGLKPVIIKRTQPECDFEYRSSVFKKNEGKEIILESTLVFKKGDKKAIQTSIEEKINYRKERQPLEYPNIGSIFKNVDLKKVPKKLHKEFAHVIKTDPFPVVPTAHLIYEAGLKGISFGGAMISPKHPNFIVNALNASAEDVKKLIALVKNKVKEKFSIDLEEEIIQL